MKKILMTLCTLSLLLFSSVAARAEVITSWNYTANVVLTNMVWSNGDDGVLAGSDQKTLTYDTAHGQESVNGYGSYQWGPNIVMNSAVTVSGSTGQLDTDGNSVTGITVTHKNGNTTPAMKGLVSGTIFTTVDLTSADGQHSYTVGSALDFYFVETINGYGYDDDIFFMTAAELEKSVGSFMVDGIVYNVTLHSQLQALTGEYLRLAQESLGVGSDTLLYGWTTAEGQTLSNAYDLSLSISMAPPSVPVPGAVWLLGTGLAGLVACRKKVSK